MPIITPKGLKGLQGIGSLSQQDYDAFVKKNDALISKHAYDPTYISNLYSNKMFIDRYGVDQFKAIPDFDMRNKLLREDVVNEEWDNLYGDMDDQWKVKYGMMSTDAKQKLLESDWLTPKEFENNFQNTWQKDVKEANKIIRDRGPLFVGNPTMPGTENPEYYALDENQETVKQRWKEANDRTLEHIYNDDADVAANRLSEQVSAAYLDPAIANLSDEQVKKAFKNAITPNPGAGNLGIPEYASHYGIVEGEGISSEMENFSIDDMRQVLAKKAVYDQYLSPDMAMTALNNEAKRYIHDHQGFGKKTALFAKDVAIAATSYTVDKANGLYNLYLMAEDGFSDEKPTVWVDTKGQVVDPTKNKLFKNKEGDVYYYDEEGNKIGAHQEQINRTTLHNMGRNMDGTEDTSIFNPLDWTRREQFGVWDKELAEQYEKLGSSPYKVAYNPNDDRDLMYESFKMMSFGLADAGAQLIPFGIGAAGKALSTASKLGSIAQKLGSGINTVSKLLTAETKVGQVLQGTAGAIGIAEAYQRGAFQETLAQNMANLEESAINKGRNEVYNKYNNDAEYKKNIDALIDARAATMKAEYLASLGENGKSQILDEKKLDEMIRAKAQDAVLGEEVQAKVNEYKGSDEYAAKQEEGINSAGWAATNAFWPEALKYGLVNNFGYRRYLYTAPTSVASRAARNFKGLREITTSAGRKRLATDIGKTVTSAEKWKNFGKVAASQIWGGAWTNGTDDMMVDAAERINEDSYSRYLHDYETGESTADTYGFVDGLWSYWKGLNNSLGQDTTWEAAAVGGLGSTISGNLHFTNIASLATKEGREAFKNNFQQRYKRDEDGMIMRDEQGNPLTEKISWKDNWRDRLGFFIQNGVLNNYYGKKQEMRNLQEHADFVNNILDDMDDFKGIESLLSSDIGRENAINIGDEKTMRFVQAFNAINTLENLGKSEKDPSTLSSVVMQHKDMIERASKLGTEEADMSEEEVNNLLGQYYSNNPGLAQTEENNQIILQNIAQNARKMKEAYEAFNKAEESIQALEKDKGAPIVAPVRFRMKLSQALDEHWKERLETMKEEIGDASSAEPTTGEALVAAVGGKGKAESILKVYGLQENTMLQGVSQAVSEQQKKLDIYNKVQNELREAEESGDSNAILQAQTRLKEARDNYEEAVEERMFREDMLAASREKKNRLQEAVDAWEKGTRSKALKADEIMALDPVTRAMMLAELKEGEADPYSPAQRKQIEKLKAQLKNFDKTGDPLQKIQDIALLTQRIAQNEDAYHRLSRNPDAAAVQLEKQQKIAAEKAYNLINERNAETLANYITEMDTAIKSWKGFNRKTIEDFAYKTLRTKSLTLLNLIEQNDLLPQYAAQVQKAKEWAKVTSDIDAVIESTDKEQEWKDNISRNIEGIVQRADSKEDIIANLEKVIDDVNDPQVAQDFETVLKGLETLGYQRDAVVVENRKKRQEKIDKDRQRIEEEKAKIERAKEEARAKAAKEAVAKAQEEAAKSNPAPAAASEAAVEQAQEEAKKQVEGAKPLAGNDASEGKPEMELDIDAEKEAQAHAPNADEETGSGEVLWNPGAERMADDAEDGDALLGEMLSGTPQNPQKGEFIVSRQTKDGKPVISFLLEQPGFDVRKPETLTVTSEEYEAASPRQGKKEGEKGSTPKEKSTSTVSIPTMNGGVTREVPGFKIDKKDIKKGDIIGYSGRESSNVIDYGTIETVQGDDVVIVTGFGSKILPSDRTYYKLDLSSRPNQPEGEPEGEPSGTVASEKRDFNVKSIEKKDDGWYFNGTFAGQKEGTQVKAKDSFDLDAAIERQKSLRQAALASQGVDVGNQHLEDLGDDVQSRSLSLEEQIAEAGMKDKVQVGDINTLEDASSTNGIREESEDNEPSTLSGNAMSEWILDKDKENKKNEDRKNPVRYEKDLSHDGALEHKRGAREKDNMNKFYAWMDAVGIKLQNIIDRELGEILRKNPELKVKFMFARPHDNATHDGDVKDTLFLVIDYDNKINKGITSIHDDANGGVITSNGKKYLVIGTVGYPNGNKAKQSLRDVLFTNDRSRGKELGVRGTGTGLVKQGSGDFFTSHPEERFWVPEDLYTEIVPYSLIPGYLVNQREGEDGRAYRKVSELLAGDRNPLGFNGLEDLKWVIQERTQFVPIGIDRSRVMRPHNPERNAGSVFLMVPAGNGKYTPAYIKPLFYMEMEDGELKQTIEKLLGELTSPSYSQRYKAAVDLARIFYFNKEGKNILVGKDKSRHANQVTLVDGEQSTTFTIDSNLDRAAFMEAFSRFNPRINITASVLMNPRSLKIYDEAGALQTDIAQLATAGSAYDIYALNGEGEIIKPETVSGASMRAASNSDFREDGASQVVYNGVYYREVEGTFYLGNDPVKDVNLIKELQYNQRIANGELEAVETKGEWESYLLGSKEHPQGIKVNKNTKKVKEMTEQEALELYEKIEKEKARKEREKAAQEEKERLKSQKEEVQIDFDEGEFVMGDNGEVISAEDKKLQDERKKSEAQDNTENESQPAEKDNAHKSEAELENKKAGTVQTFSTLVKNREYRKEVIGTIKAKWPDAPSKIAELEQFLKRKSVEVASIGTDKASIDAWIKTVKECR